MAGERAAAGASSAAGSSGSAWMEAVWFRPCHGQMKRWAPTGIPVTEPPGWRERCPAPISPPDGTGCRRERRAIALRGETPVNATGASGVGSDAGPICTFFSALPVGLRPASLPLLEGVPVCPIACGYLRAGMCSCASRSPGPQAHRLWLLGPCFRRDTQELCDHPCHNSPQIRV